MTAAVAAARVARSRPGVVLVVASVVTATASLVAPATLTFDPWAWLVWGRELGRLDLDTTGGPAWKPLPVLLSTVYAPFGSAAPALWMITARAAGLLALAGTYRLAARVAGPVAGVVAVAVLLLAPDGDPRFLRLVGEAHGALLPVAALVFAADAALDGRRRRVLWLVWVAALSRPEAWPFLAVAAAWCWHGGSSRREVVGVLASVPLLWFGFDWWGSGEPWHGAEQAQVGLGDPVGGRTLEALGVIGAMVVAPAWVAAGVAVVTGRRDGARPLARLGVAALVWCAVVVGMALVLGYAAISRFVLPAAAIIAVLAGVGVVRAAAAVRGTGRPAVTALAALVAVAALGLVLPRVAGLADMADLVADRGALADDLEQVLDDAGGRDALVACTGTVAAEATLLRPSVAWLLDLPLHRVPPAPPDGPGVMVARSGGRWDADTTARPGAVTLARSPDWVVVAVDCP